MIVKHMFKHPRTTQERRQFYADKADGLPARVRTRYRPTSYDDVKHARQPRRRYKPWSCR